LVLAHNGWTIDIYPSWMNVINASMNAYHHYVKMKSIHPYINHGWMDVSIKRDAKKMNAHEHEKFTENDTKKSKI